MERLPQSWHREMDATTRQKNMEAIRNHIFPILRNQSVKDIKPLDILKLVKAIEHQVKLDTARRVFGLLPLLTKNQ